MNGEPCYSSPTIPRYGSLLPPLSAGIDYHERGKHWYCGWRNQSNLSLKGCEPGQPETLHLRLPPSVYPETTASFQSALHLCISVYLRPPLNRFCLVFHFACVLLSRNSFQLG